MSTNGSMSEYHRILSVFFEVLFPYFKHKIDENINYLRLEEADGCLRNVILKITIFSLFNFLKF